MSVSERIGSMDPIGPDAMGGAWSLVDWQHGISDDVRLSEQIGAPVMDRHGVAWTGIDRQQRTGNQWIGRESIGMEWRGSTGWDRIRRKRCERNGRAASAWTGPASIGLESSRAYAIGLAVTESIGAWRKGCEPIGVAAWDPNRMEMTGGEGQPWSGVEPNRDEGCGPERRGWDRQQRMGADRSGADCSGPDWNVRRIQWKTERRR